MEDFKDSEKELRQRGDEDVAIMRTWLHHYEHARPPYQLTRLSYLQLRRWRHFLLAVLPLCPPPKSACRERLAKKR
jgi:hypothetical protein